MTVDEVKVALGKAVRRCWPNAAKASDLPFPDYWKGVAEWLAFHAPRLGDALMWKLIDGFAVSAKEAEERGEAPTPPKVPESVKRIWENHAQSGPAQPAILTDRSKVATCGDGWSDIALISPRGGLGSAAPDRQGESRTSCGRPKRRPIEQGILL